MSHVPYARPRASSAAGHEDALVQGLKARSAEAWSELYNAHYERLRKYAFARLASREDAEDIASQVFLRALRRIDSYECNGKPILAWLYGITQNLLRERRREQNREEVPASAARPGDAEPVEAGREDPDVAQLLDLMSALDTLTPRQREAVTLLHLGGFRVSEVATILGKSERSVYYLEARALIRLRDELLSQEEGT